LLKLLKNIRILEHCCRQWGMVENRSKIWKQPSTKLIVILSSLGTPIDLRRIIKINKPSTRIYYELDEIAKPNLSEILSGFMKKHGLK